MEVSDLNTCLKVSYSSHGLIYPEYTLQTRVATLKWSESLDIRSLKVKLSHVDLKLTVVSIVRNFLPDPINDCLRACRL